MEYDEDLLVELIACGDVSQTEIAERVGVSRRTVWRIANGHSRPDLQQKIADTVEGFRQATIRMAAKWMKPLLSKQIKVALEGDGETARKCREFLLKTFMLTVPQHAAKTAAKRKPRYDDDRRLDGIALYNSLVELSPELKDQVVKELGGPTDERSSTTDTTDDTDGTDVEKTTATATEERVSTTDSTDGTDVEKTTATPLYKGKEVPPPFSTKVTLPNGQRVYRESLRIIEEAKAEAESIPTRRRVQPGPQ